MARGRKTQQTAEEEATSFVKRVLNDKEEMESEVEARVGEEMEARGIPSPQTEQTLAEEEVNRKLRSEGIYNIFHDIDTNYFKKGDGIDVEYTIFLNNIMQGSKAHPYSWEKLQQDFPDGGRFKVVAYSTIDREYLRQETRTISAYRGPRESVHHSAPVEQKGSSMEDTMKLLAFVRELNPPAPPPPPQANNNEFLMKMMMDANQNTMNLIMKMQEQTNLMMEKISSSFGSALKDIGEKFEKTKEEKSKGPDAFELQKMLNEARKEGYNERKDLEELVEEKAAERAELLSAAEGTAPKTGMIEKLAESFLPVVSQGLLLQQQAASAASTQNPPARPSQPPQAGVAQRAERAASPQPGAAPRPPQPPRAPHLVRVDGRAKFDPSRAGGVPPRKRVSDDDNKMRVIMALIPGLAQAKNMEEAVLTTEKTLQGMGMQIPDALRIVSRADMMEVAQEKLPKETLPVLEEFYTALEARAGIGAANPTTEESRESVSDSAPSDAREHAALN